MNAFAKLIKNEIRKQNSTNEYFRINKGNDSEAQTKNLKQYMQEKYGCPVWLPWNFPDLIKHKICMRSNEKNINMIYSIFK